MVEALEEVGTSWEIATTAWVRNDETHPEVVGRRMWGTFPATAVFPWAQLGSR